MRAAAATSPGIVAMVDIPLPEYNEYECLVQTTACGLCNSTDLKIIEGDLHNFDVTFPLTFGHEGVGRVVEVGTKVRNIHEGEVYVNPTGRLMPGTGFHSMWTAMAEYSIVRDTKAMEDDGVDPDLIPRSQARLVPPEMSSIDAAVLLTVKENYSALKNFAVKPGQDVLVYGDGPVGFGMVNLLRIMEAGFVCCTGHHEERLRWISETAKADLCINTKTANLDEQLGERQFDLVIDAVGKSAIILDGATRLKPGGRIGSYGVLHRDDAAVNLLDLPNNVVLHMLNFPYGEHDAHWDVLNLVEEKHVDLTEYYSNVMPIERISEAVDLVKNRRTKKVIITFDEK